MNLSKVTKDAKEAKEKHKPVFTISAMHARQAILPTNEFKSFAELMDPAKTASNGDEIGSICVKIDGRATDIAEFLEGADFFAVFTDAHGKSRTQYVKAGSRALQKALPGSQAKVCLSISNESYISATKIEDHIESYRKDKKSSEYLKLLRRMSNSE